MLVLEIGRKMTVGQLAFAPDGRMLAAGCGPGTYLWQAIGDASRTKQLPVLGTGRVQFTADGHCILTGYSELHRIDASTGANTVWRLWGGYNTLFDVSPTAQLILVSQSIGTTGSVRTRFALWRIDDLSKTGKVWEQEFAINNYYPPQFLAGGERFVRYEYIRAGGTSGRVIFCDTATGATLTTQTFTASAPYEALSSPDGRQLAVRGTHRIDLFHLDSADARPLRICNDSRRHFTDMAFHPAGRYLAATSNDETVKLYDTATGDVGRIFTWKIGRMRSVCFSPDGMLAAAGSDKGQVVVWDVDV